VTRPVFFIDNIDSLEFKSITHDYQINSTSETIASIFFTSGTTSRPKGVCHTTHNMLANAIAFNKLVGLTDTVSMLHVMPMGYMAGFLNTILCPILAGGSVFLAPQFNAKDA